MFLVTAMEKQICAVGSKWQGGERLSETLLESTATVDKNYSSQLGWPPISGTSYLMA